MKTPVEKKIIATVGILLGLVIIISAAVIWPTLQKIRAMNRDSENLLRYLETKYENAKNLRSSLNKAREIKEEVLSFEKRIFRKGDELKLITDLEDIANKNRLSLKIESSNIDNIVGQHVEMSLLVGGNYHNALRYLADLENSDYFININKIYFTPLFDKASGSAGQNANLRVSITLYVNK